MKTTHHNQNSPTHPRKRLLAILALGAALGIAERPALASHDDLEPYSHSILRFDTSLTSFNMAGGPFQMPLASDPTNALGDSVQGFGYVRSAVTITLSSQHGGLPTLGSVIAIAEPAGMVNENTAGLMDYLLALGGVDDGIDYGPVNPSLLDGRQTMVLGRFSVHFDISVTDVDARPGRNFAGRPDGASISLLNNGPGGMQSLTRFISPGNPANGPFPIFNMAAPNFGLLPPPEGAPYGGHFNIEIPLGGDINGNGYNDRIRFSLVTHSAIDGARTFVQLPDGTVIDSFDSAAALDGAIVDDAPPGIAGLADLSLAGAPPSGPTHAPFMIGMLDPLTGLPDPNIFGGPVTATSRLTTPMVPEPSQAILAIIGGAATLARRRRIS